MSLDDVQIHYVDSLDTADRFMHWLGERREVLAVDTETGGLEFWREPLRLVTFGDTRQGWAVSWHDWAGLVKEAITKYDHTPVVMHNMKFDFLFLEHNGVKLRRDLLDDTMLMAHVLNPTQPVALKSLSSRLIDSRAAGGQRILSEAMRKQGWTWRDVPTDFEPYWTYGALDAVLTAKLYELFRPEITAHHKSIYDLELASTLVLADMERRGVRVDLEYTSRKFAEAERWVSDTASYIRQTFGIDNPNSNEQVIQRLLDDHVPLTARTDKGNVKLDEEVLASLSHPLAKSVLDIRKTTKIANTYFKNFIELADGDIIHPSIRAVGARTGRMSITSPALQTLPRGPVVRDAFVAREDHRMLLVDFDQVEMRVFAHFAQERAMIDAILSGVDLHNFMCRKIYGIPDEVPESDVKNDPRRQVTKNANFAKIYGGGIATFARTAGIAEGEARTFMASYEGQFPGVKQFHMQVEQKAKERFAAEGQAFVTTPYGRRHPVELDKTYKLVNYLIQGTCADLLKSKLVELDNAGFGDYMVLPVHDEIVFDVPGDLVNEAAPEIERTMTEVQKFVVPLTAGVDIVDRWGDKYR